MTAEEAFVWIPITLIFSLVTFWLGLFLGRSFAIEAIARENRFALNQLEIERLKVKQEKEGQP